MQIPKQAVSSLNGMQFPSDETAIIVRFMHYTPRQLSQYRDRDMGRTAEVQLPAGAMPRRCAELSSPIQIAKSQNEELC
jgi:hypothetical protein